MIEKLKMHLRYVIRAIIVTLVTMLAIWLIFHIGFYVGYQTHKAEYDAIENLETRGLIIRN